MAEKSAERTAAARCGGTAPGALRECVMFRMRSDETSDSGTDLNMASTSSSTDFANAGPIAKTRDGVSTLGRRSVKHQGHAQLMLHSLRGTAVSQGCTAGGSDLVDDLVLEMRVLALDPVAVLRIVVPRSELELAVAPVLHARFYTPPLYTVCIPPPSVPPSLPSTASPL